MARHCVIANCSNGSYRLMRWKEKECSIHNDLHGSDVCTCEPPFSLWPIPPRKREPAQRDKWKRLINRIQPGTTNQLLSPSKDQKVCSRHFKDGKPTEANPFPTECLGYPGFERKAARILRFNTEKTNPYTPKITLRNMQRAKPSSDTQSSSSSKATSQTPGTPKEQRQTTTINVSAGKQLRLAQTTFTVEQIELIRRLRNSGLTKKQVVLAFDAFEKVDAELGNVYTSPVSLARPNTLLLRTVSQPSQIQTSDSRGPRLVGPQTTFPVSLQHAVNVPCSTASVPSPQVAATLSTTVHPSSTVTLTSQPPQSVVPPATIRTSGTRGPRLIAPKTTYPVSIRRAVLVPCSATSVLSPQVATTLTTTVQPSGTATLTSPPPQSAVPPVTVTTAATGRVNRRFPVRVVRRVKTEREDSVQDGGGGLVSPEASAVASGGISSVDVDEFLNKGTEKMLEEISEFLLAHPDLAHSDIAEAAGVDLTSVGKFLIGSFSALASLTLQQLCLWFLREHRQQSQQESMQQSQQQEQQQQYSMNTTTMLQSAVQEGAVVTTAFEGVAEGQDAEMQADEADEAEIQDHDAASAGNASEEEDQPQQNHNAPSVGNVAEEEEQAQADAEPPRKRRRVKPQDPVRLSHADNPHKPVPIPPTKKCPRPTRRCECCTIRSAKTNTYIRRAESTYMCQACKVPLCIHPCFDMYHTIKDFKQEMKRYHNINDNGE
ncbi:uncharacterized protein LOC143295430 isoform X2 [Babylonia areolata]|uniref:uncharacterized protein LOC143295430 isoform X2 n=1 Tax=Babylonia areolata TaxID=304850 RepID=UPI003FD16ECA